MKRYYVKNQVILEWYGDEILKQLARGKEHSERETAERVYRRAVANAKPGSYRRSFRNVYFALGDKEKKKPIRMKPWQQRMPGRLRASIRKMVSKYKQGGFVVMAGDFLAYYARIVEFGTKARRQKTTGRFTGMQRKGSRYMRKVIGQEKRFLLNSIRQQINALRGMNT